MQKITTFLWFDGHAEDAMNHYVSIFKYSKVLSVTRWPEGHAQQGQVLVASFELDGVTFQALNGGPQYKFSPAVSLTIPCADQAEVDYYWDRLTDGGQEIACGWLQDQYGLSWQVIPTAFMEMISDPDPEKVRRVTEAMLTMKKMDIAALRAAYADG